MLEKLYRKFGLAPVNEEKLLVLGKELFEASELQLLKEKIPREPIYAGKLVGFVRDKDAIPSLDELRRIASEAQKKIWVNPKAEFLFICGRNILQTSIVKKAGSPVTGDAVFVMNLHDECLGYAVYGETVTKVFDMGDFLRRERKKSVAKPFKPDKS